jgi:hypothetical protein
VGEPRLASFDGAVGGSMRRSCRAMSQEPGGIRWRPWTPHARAIQRRRSAVEIAKLVLASEGILNEHRNQLLSVAIWKHTEADGKYTTRFRSEGALGISDVSKL